LAFEIVSKELKFIGRNYAISRHIGELYCYMTLAFEPSSFKLD